MGKKQRWNLYLSQWKRRCHSGECWKVTGHELGFGREREPLSLKRARIKLLWGSESIVAQPRSPTLSRHKNTRYVGVFARFRVCDWGEGGGFGGNVKKNCTFWRDLGARAHTKGAPKSKSPQMQTIYRKKRDKHFPFHFQHTCKIYTSPGCRFDIKPTMANVSLLLTSGWMW